VLEDTDVSYFEIKDNFGIQIADGVLALTKNIETKDKNAQIRDNLVKIKKQPLEIWMVKLCDRITNLQLPPPSHWSNQKVIRYRDSAMIILKSLSKANKYLAIRLEDKIKDYSKFIAKF